MSAPRVHCAVALTKLVATKVLAGLLTLISCAASLEASILVNGSFEDLAVTDGGYSLYDGGSTLIPGWTVVGNDVAVVSTTFKQNEIAFQAQEGKQWMDLSGETSNSQTNGVSQVISTVIGVDYLVTFFVGSASDVNSISPLFLESTIKLSIDGVDRKTSTNGVTPSDRLNWKQSTHVFTATSTVTEITFYNGGAWNNNNSALDNVSVTRMAANPEDASALIWGVLVLGVGSVARVRSEY